MLFTETTRPYLIPEIQTLPEEAFKVVTEPYAEEMPLKKQNPDGSNSILLGVETRQKQIRLHDGSIFNSQYMEATRFQYDPRRVIVGTYPVDRSDEDAVLDLELELCGAGYAIQECQMDYVVYYQKSQNYSRN